MKINELMEEISIAEAIKTNCQPYLNAVDFEVSGNELYRGLVSNTLENLSMGLKTVRQEGRNPSMTDQDDHDLLNTYFNKKYGHPYRNGLFASGRKLQAADYGTPYVIFPVGDFDFIYHDKINDLYVNVIDSVRAFNNWDVFAQSHGITQKLERKAQAQGIESDTTEMDEYIYDGVWEWKDITPITALIDWLGPYKSVGLQQAIFSDHEIMIWCKQYYYMLPAMVDKINWKD